MSWHIPNSEPLHDWPQPRYFTRIEGGPAGAYRELLDAPTLALDLRLSLSLQVEALSAVAHLHGPGDGWHHVPAGAEYVHNGENWFATLPTSEGAILADVADLCSEIGIAYETLYRAAYPTSGGAIPTVTAADRAMRARPARLDDAAKVLADLEAVNYHSLRGALADALRMRGIPTSE